MGNFLSMQSEEIILIEDVDQYTINVKDYKTLIVQLYSDDGVLKNVKVKSNTVLPNVKVLLKKGDVIKYIAVF